MNKGLTVLTLLAVICIGYGQRLEVVKSKIDFTSDAPLELINANSDNARGLIDPITRQFAFIIKTSSFKGFNSELQREHFNEKYMESEKFYESSFSGRFIDSVNFKVEGVYRVNAKGTLLLHGKKQPRTIPGTITITKDKIVVDAEFKVLLVDHDIQRPNVVGAKIASEILVKVTFELEEKKAR